MSAWRLRGIVRAGISLGDIGLWTNFRGRSRIVENPRMLGSGMAILAIAAAMFAPTVPNTAAPPGPAPAGMVWSRAASSRWARPRRATACARSWFTAGIAIAAVLFTISAVANLIGNVTLAELLAGATLTCTFRAAACVVAVVVFAGALRALFKLAWARRFRVVRDHEEAILSRLGWLLRLAAFALWARLTLQSFHLTQAVRDAGSRVLDLRIKVGGLDVAVGDVVAFAVTLWIAVWLARALKFILDEAVFPSIDIRKGSAAALSTTASYAIIGIGFVSAVLAAGVEMTRFTVLAGTLGVGIGFGLQNVVNNFVSGLILLYERPVQVGDLIELGELSGEIKRIGVRSSTVRTYLGADVIVPNSNFVSATVTNWTGADRFRRVDISLSVARGSDPGRMSELLLGIARANGAVLSEPAPTAVLVGFGGTALQFELRFWTGVDDWVNTASALRAGIVAALKDAGIVLANPQSDLWIRSLPARLSRAADSGLRATPGSIGRRPAGE
jgi:potassium-dependent mechanosensitive channel